MEFSGPAAPAFADGLRAVFFERAGAIRVHLHDGRVQAHCLNAHAHQPLTLQPLEHASLGPTANARVDAVPAVVMVRYRALLAAIAAIGVSRDGGRREWKVAKSKDGQDGGSHQFTLEIKTLGTDEDGPVTSCVVVPTFGQVHEAKLTANQQNGMNAFNAVGGVGVDREAWREEFYSRSTAENSVAKRQAFNRVVKDLVKLGMLTVNYLR